MRTIASYFFRCSVVGTYNTFWVKLTSEVINYVQKDCTAKQTTVAPAQTTSPITTPAVRPVSTTKRPIVPEVATTTAATTTAAPVPNVTRSTSGPTDRQTTQVSSTATASTVADGSAGSSMGNETSKDPKNSVRSATCITEIVFAAVAITMALVF